MNHASKTYNHKLPNNIYGISSMRSDGNPAVKIERGGGQQRYLYCKDREFPSNFDVVPKKYVNFYSISSKSKFKKD